jgi:phospholipase C
MPALSLTRRLAARCLAATIALTACGHKGAPAVTVTDAQADAARKSCTYGVGALPKDTLATDAPLGAQIPIDHVILIMQENRSFDHYFSKLSHGGVDVAAPDATNPDSTGKPVSRFHQTNYCFADLDHSWLGERKEVDCTAAGCANDGFVMANEPDGQRAMGYYDETDIPFYYGLARTFAISDRHFCSVPGPTAPNRLFYNAATSFGMTDNPGIAPDMDPDGNPTVNILTRLSDAQVDWKVYSSVGATIAGEFLTTFSDHRERFLGEKNFWVDAAAGTLPTVAYIEESELDNEGSDEHPNADMQLGEAWVAKVVNAVMHSPNWRSAAIFITWDEHDGLYDHVAPPAACPPDKLPPLDNANKPLPGAFDVYGVRVPLLVVSPYAKHGFVSHHVSDHTSILRFLEARFNMPAMTARDANADPLFDMFDFQHPDMSVPTLPTAPVDVAKAMACGQAIPAP